MLSVTIIIIFHVKMLFENISLLLVTHNPLLVTGYLLLVLVTVYSIPFFQPDACY